MKKKENTGKESKIRIRKNQKGSTLITVLVGVSFMVILASIILSISFANLHMKQIEYAAKQNFYEDELGLQDVYNGIGREATECLTKAYHETLMQVTNAQGEGVFQNQQAAYEDFVKNFGDNLSAAFQTDTLNILRSYVTLNETNVSERTDKSFTTVESCGEAKLNDEKTKFIFKDVVVTYTERDDTGNDTGYESVITTDIVIEIPYIRFFQDFSRVLDYSLVGNKGIYFKNGSDCIVEGNVYAGIDSKENNADYMGYKYDGDTVYDGMNFYQTAVTFNDNSYLVSRGDFNICESRVTVGLAKGSTSPASEDSLTVHLWAENIRTVERERDGKAGLQISKREMPPASELYAYADMYVANDLELSARNSTVNLSGNYYGYNYNGNAEKNAYETSENKNIKDKYESVEGKIQASHTTSSSILINANESTLNLSELDTLIIAGLAYVDVKNPASFYNEMTERANEYATGESLALRYNQFLYLAPAEILYVSNPAKNVTITPEEACPGENAENSKLNDWFGKDYLRKSEPVIPVVYNVDGENYTYYFLNFDGEEKKNEYMQEVFGIEANPGETGDKFEKQKWELKQEVVKRAANAGMKAQVAIDATGCKIYTKGIVTDTDSGKVYHNTETLPTIYNNSLNMANHFIYLHQKLDPKEQYSETSTALTLQELDDDIVNYRLDKDMLPIDYFVDLNRVAGKDIEETVNGYDVIVKTSEVPITEDVNGIVIAKENVTLKNIKVNGLILAGGKIIVEGNCEIKSDKGIVQSILESEQRKIAAIDKSKVKDADTYWRHYASYYFKHADKTLMDETEHVDYAKRVNSTEYADFMYYENWQKGTR